MTLYKLQQTLYKLLKPVNPSLANTLLMLSFTILALAAAAVYANPLSPRTTDLEAVGALPHSDLVADVTEPTMLACSSPNCVGCTRWSLQGLGESNCFFIGSFVSVGIDNPSNVFHVAIDIAPNNCQNWLEIPQDNVCFNINGGPFTQYGALDI